MSAIIIITVMVMAALSAICAVVCFYGKSNFAYFAIFTHARSAIGCVIKRRRAVCADRQLPDALLLLCNSLKAGLALPQAVDLASSLLAPPLSEEFGRVVAQQRMGKDFDSAFLSLSDSIPTEDLILLTQSVEVLRRTGGNLVETFSSINNTITERRRVEDKIRSLTSQGVAQAATLLLLPWLLAALLALMAPDFISPLYSTRLGICLITVAVLMEVVGAVWLRKIVMIRV